MLVSNEVLLIPQQQVVELFSEVGALQDLVSLSLI